MKKRVKSEKPTAAGQAAEARGGNSDPEIEAEPPAFTASPLPSTYELASLAALLMNDPPQHAGDSSYPAVRTAVDLALTLWAAALERNSERNVETARLSLSLDRPAAEHRYHQWQLRIHGTEEEYLKWQQQIVQSAQRAAKCFQGLRWPAAFDDVMRRIMDGSVDDSGEIRRHKEYVSVWLGRFEAATRDRIHADAESRQPGTYEALEEAPRRAGVDEAWRFSGPGITVELSSRRLAAAVETLRREHAERVQRYLEAELGKLRERAENMRGEKWDEREAAEALELWSRHRLSCVRKAAGSSKKKHSRGRSQVP